jgi:lysine 6-dehydrogenase
MVEKTMRYPGHAERMRMLRETGFFGEDRPWNRPMAPAVRPLDVTARCCSTPGSSTRGRLTSR